MRNISLASGTILLTCFLSCIVCGPVFSQGAEARLTHEEFAVELVKSMKLEGFLPTAAVGRDCIDLLERLGVSPLGGWNPKALLEREDYLVIMAKAQGKESTVHERAMQVQEKNTEVINAKWQEVKDKTGAWIALDTLLSDKNYFPDGAPKSPYDLSYEDRNGDHKVDPHSMLVTRLMKIRERYITP